jgi:hypothetical protein
MNPRSRLSLRSTCCAAGALAALMVTSSALAEPPQEATKATARKDESQKVVSKDKSLQSRPPSLFLRQPSGDRYEPDGVNWSEVPAWKQATFFGVRARGQFFVYVVDCSGSMIEEDRLARAKEEVRRSVLRLVEPQRFKVIFYNDRPIPMPGDLAKSADFASKEQLLAWLRLIEPDGETDPRSSISLALNHRPDAVFLLSDGEFPEGTAEAVARANGRKVPIHCIDLSGGLAADQLPRIARDSGGRYVLRPWPAQ